MSRSSRRWRMSSSPKACSTRHSSASAATGRSSRIGRRSSPSRRHSPEVVGALSGVPAEEIRGAARLLRHGRQWRDLLRPRRHRAQPGLDHRHRDRQPRHGDRQYRPSGRRREPAARPEQRAGRLRHGLVPARTAGLPPHLRRCDARHLREACGASSSTTSRACASPTCWMPPSTARSRASTSRARTSCSPTPTPSMSRPGWRRWNASSCTTSSSTRPRTTRMSSCPARPSSRRTAPSPMPSAASTACAR